MAVPSFPKPSRRLSPHSKAGALILGGCLLLLLLSLLLWDGDTQILTTTMESPLDMAKQTGMKSRQDIIDIFESLHARLLVPNVTRAVVSHDIQAAVDFSNQYASIVQPLVEDRMKQRHKVVQAACQKNASQILETGAWCLHPDLKDTVRRYVIPSKKIDFPLAYQHVHASQNIVQVLKELFAQDRSRSLLDMGAGIGQYKYELQHNVSNHKPTLAKYHALDGAGNIEEYTQGYVSYADFSLPLFAQRADWVLSLEVGEHVAPQYEAMYLRNLHYHNCRGIVLSWAIPDQGGHGHINLHSNSHVIEMFEYLGYVWDQEWSEKLRAKENNYHWFERTSLLFRRKHPLC